MVAVNLSQAVVETLQKQQHPIGIDELAFIVRTIPSNLSGVIERLKKTNVIDEIDTHKYKLNQQKEFRLMEAY